MEVAKHICNYTRTGKNKIIFDEYPVLNENDTTCYLIRTKKWCNKNYKIRSSGTKKERIRYFIYLFDILKLFDNKYFTFKQQEDFYNDLFNLSGQKLQNNTIELVINGENVVLPSSSTSKYRLFGWPRIGARYCPYIYHSVLIYNYVLNLDYCHISYLNCTVTNEAYHEKDIVNFEYFINYCNNNNIIIKFNMPYLLSKFILDKYTLDINLSSIDNFRKNINIDNFRKNIRKKFYNIDKVSIQLKDNLFDELSHSIGPDVKSKLVDKMRDCELLKGKFHTGVLNISIIKDEINLKITSLLYCYVKSFQKTNIRKMINLPTKILNNLGITYVVESLFDQNVLNKLKMKLAYNYSICLTSHNETLGLSKFTIDNVLNLRNNCNGLNRNAFLSYLMYIKLNKHINKLINNITTILISNLQNSYIKICNSILLTNINKIKIFSHCAIMPNKLILEFTSLSKHIIEFKYKKGVTSHDDSQNTVDGLERYTYKNGQYVIYRTLIYNNFILLIRKFNYYKDAKYIIPLLKVLKTSNYNSYVKFHTIVKKILKLIHICNIYYKNKLFQYDVTNILVKRFLKNSFK